ncbi:uncharacterized protein LOC113936191 isoform X3 [Zalophus californianus]|uniref:Uncharacterized protein LOC113936191 isoform X3 n=1 Tax=Zalophus californianus TaxID=9704 RepID=A0A6J2F124_ZALCA|nr:uncharacterized protein LOC113936191 isoform X3 [Zalophus californianus]
MERDKEGANEEEEKEDRHRVNYRWTQKTQVTAIRRQRGQPSEKEDGQDAGLGPEKAWGVGRVPVWPLWTILLLGNKNEGTLYTPDDLSVCPAETLGCFRLELSVIQFEEGPSLGIAVFRLQRLLDALGSRLWVTGQGPCPPCEGHPQRPVPLFLAKLLELLQGACAQHRPSA